MISFIRPFTVIFISILLAGPAFGDFGDELKEFDFEASEIKRDDTRDRVYVVCPHENSVKVIDSSTLNVVASIFTGSNPKRMDLSPDSSTLYVANTGTSTDSIALIDLESLTVTGHLIQKALRGTSQHVTTILFTHWKVRILNGMI